MDVVLLSRIQFALNIGFHYLFPPMSIGLSWIIVILEGMYLKTRKPEHKSMVQFWTKIFALFFAMGVASGFVQVFAFGNNWSGFSKFVGDVFGTLLAAEGVFAFFLEAGFLGIMIFGWEKVSPWFHYLSTILVSLGATFSATWIVMANSWMQTPSGFKIIGEGINKRAVITSLWDVYFSPSFLDRLGHVLLGCWIVSIFLLLSISSFYLLKNKHVKFAGFTIRFSLVMAIVALSLQLWSADSSARGVAKYQPAKLAAMEGLYQTTKNAPFSLIGIVDTEQERVIGISVPYLLSLLVNHNLHEAVTGLNEFPKEDWPYVPAVFYCYRTMIYSWGAMMLYAVVGLILWRRLEKNRWYLWLAVFSIIFPYLANTSGWFTAEMGRQPWIVYNVMRTMDGVSKVLVTGNVVGSLIMFISMYTLLGSLFVFLLNRKIQTGPVAESKAKDKHAHYRDPYMQSE